MKRVISLLTLVAIMVAMVLASALPAFAQGKPPHSQGKPPCEIAMGLETAHEFAVPEMSATEHGQAAAHTENAHEFAIPCEMM